ncbi:MAG TPA: xanthine dehydrogenase family protein subunit M [Dehalococcoidia bacterium]|nr:xanthine dehydrogenase family protein subunit M [Dehalococcoidia bacterium]
MSPGEPETRKEAMRNFEYLAPESLDEAVRLLAEHGERTRPIAGGTDIVVQMKENATRFPYPERLVSLNRIPELKGIEFTESAGLRIGAGVTMAEIAESPVVRERYTAIAEGAGVVGSWQTMNMATLGGNLCNAAPSADTAPALLAFGAQATIAGPAGKRSIDLADLFAGPGQTTLGAGEVLAEIVVPAPPPRTGSAYRRHTPRKQMDIAVVGVGTVVTLDGSGRTDSARIALGAVAPTPVRAPKAEAWLASQSAGDEAFARAAEIAAGECSPISDLRGSAEFRQHLVRVMVERIVRVAVQRAR